MVTSGSAPAEELAALTNPPLCVDLDGTLILTDTLWDGVASLLRKGLAFLWLPIWLLRGKAHLKKQVAHLGSLDVTTLPYNEALVADLRRYHRAGREIWLSTGADRLVAERSAAHLGVFTGVIASDGTVNLTGARKRSVLTARFGKGGFDYIGNSRADIPVWRDAREAQVVHPSWSLQRAMQRSDLTIGTVYEKPRTSKLRVWLETIRIHQWAKNLLILLPVVLGHRLSALPDAGLAFLAFGLVASSGYLINDTVDLQEDRRHHTKRNRPIARGAVGVTSALAVIPILWLLAAGICLLLPPTFGVILAIYLAFSLAYSLWLKRKPLLDLMMLAGLYTIRISAGGAATNIVISQWTLAFSVFLFLSLAMVKRVSELREFHESETLNVPGRSYMRVDIQQLGALGSASGYMSVLVTALYINSPEVQLLYSKPHWLWFILPPLLYWISRMWLLANRGHVNQDPIVFALRDRVTYIAAGLVVAVAFAAI
jgi:4-hydroxybenzoate polyprenyltransferase